MEKRLSMHTQTPCHQPAIAGGSRFGHGRACVGAAAVGRCLGGTQACKLGGRTPRAARAEQTKRATFTGNVPASDG